MVKNGLISVWGIELDMISVPGSELTRLFSGGRKILGYLVGVEKYLVAASGSTLSWFLCRGIELDLISELGSN